MPRLPRLLEKNLEPYVAAAKEILKSKGIPKSGVKLTQVVEMDLDGDKVKEVLVCANQFTMANFTDSMRVGDYSMVFIHKPTGKNVRNILIDGQFRTPSHPVKEPA